MLITENYHTHTYRCRHAGGTDRDYVEAAIAAGLTTLGFSDHSPMVFTTDHKSSFRMSLEETPGYFESLLQLREEYKDRIRILIGVEAEYYPACWQGYLAFMRQFPLDYKILGQHFVFDEEHGGPGAFQETTDPERLRDYYNCVLEGVSPGEFLYVAHPDVLHYVGDPAAYDDLTRDFLRRLEPTGIPLEINRLGLHDGRNYPNPRFWDLVAETSLPAVIGLDAHAPHVFRDDKSVADCLAIAESRAIRVVSALL